jgi:predicted extracellular nuclease
MKVSKVSHRIFSVLVVLALCLSWLPAIPVFAATPTELFFSEYIEGSSNNKALEIYNGTGAAIDLAAGGYNVFMSFNGGTSTLTINLVGSVAVGDVFVLAQASANATILAQADQTNGAGWYNGDDAVVLRKGTTVIDSLGQIGFDPGTEWGTGLISTADNTLRRLDTICAGDPNGTNAFDPSLEWEGFATDTFGGLGAHYANCAGPDAAPEVTSSYPVDGQTNVPINADMSITFSEPVNVIDPWYTLSCTVSGSHTAVVNGGPTTFTLNPTDFVGGETCTLVIIAENVRDQDTNDPPDAMALNFTVGFTTIDVCALPYTSIPAIQGSGATVALTGTRTTQGVVVGDYEGPSPALRGFFIQDSVGDGNPATSDGIFVFEGSNANTVSLGDIVRVTGTAGENQGQSQISVGTIVKCGTGTVTPTDVTFPVASADFLEQYEGMLVRLPQMMYVTEHFQLGRFGQVVLSSGARLQQPTNVVAPGAPAQALQAQNNLNKIILDDASQVQNPDPILFARGGLPLSASNTLRGGDTATNIVGVLNYTWAGNAASGNAYRVRPVNALNGYVNFKAVNERPTAAPAVGGTLKVVGMNLLNYFNTFDGLPDTVDNCTLGVGGAATDCRGADTQAEFDRQYPKTVAAILAMNPDVLGVNEIENDGYGPTSAIAHLVDQLNAATAPGTYAFIDVDAATGQVNALGTDAIKVNMIYKPAVVTPVGQTAVLNTVAFVNGGDTAPRSRPSLAQAFRQNSNGAVFIVDVNHLKSKGSACDVPDALDGQGNCNIVRTNAAIELMSWLATDPTSTGDPDILLLGDYNSYAMEDPITVIKNAGFTNMIESFLGPDAYSYVFDGQWGYLDHALGSGSIVSQVTGVGDYHINSDEPSVLDYNTDFKTVNLQNILYAPDQFRVSDHDPVIVGLDLKNYPPELGDITVTPNLAAINTSVSASVPFTDPDKLDTHTATWVWGDGSTSTGAVSESQGSGTISGDHTYAMPGVYTVSVTVNDGYGNSDTAIYEFVVVYDPNGGFVTGGGWIDSPAGAYTADPTLTGKATFGFVSKYKKGTTVPEGNTQFQFHAAGFNFSSTSYDWLVVAGSKAQFKGTGTINGEGVYKFMITADDGNPDTFRIKIWQEVNGVEIVVYDNGSQQPLGGGSITVHK